MKWYKLSEKKPKGAKNYLFLCIAGENSADKDKFYYFVGRYCEKYHEVWFDGETVDYEPEYWQFLTIPEGE